MSFIDADPDDPRFEHAWAAPATEAPASSYRRVVEGREYTAKLLNENEEFRREIRRLQEKIKSQDLTRQALARLGLSLTAVTYGLWAKRQSKKVQLLVGVPYSFLYKYVSDQLNAT